MYNIKLYFFILFFYYLYFWDSSLLVYRDTTDVCMLLFCPVTFLNLFISSNSFLVDSLGFSLYKIMSYADREDFTFFFLTWMPFISFFSDFYG